MVSHDKKLYNNLLQMAMLASLLRLQPDMYGLHDQAVDGDLILGQSWAHTSARTIHSQLEHFASHKNIDNVLERYQEEVFEELNALGRYNRIYASDIQAYQVLDGEVTAAGSGLSATLPAAEPAPAASPAPPPDLGGLELNVTALDLELDRDLDLDLDLELGLAAPPAVAPPSDFDVWEMMDADLAEAGPSDEPWTAGAVRDSFSSDASDDFIQLDAEMSDEDAEAIEVLLKQDVDLGLTRDDLDPIRSFSDDFEDENGLALDKPQQEWSEPPPPVADGGAQPADDDDDDDPLRELWAGLDYAAVDSETGEYVPRAPAEAPDPEPAAAAAALPGPAERPPPAAEQRPLGASPRRQPDHPDDKVAAARHPSGEDSGQGSSAESEPGDAELGLLDEMIQTAQHHPASMQGRLPFIRTMSMEQRWQDLASLLSLPTQDPNMTHAHQHMLASAHHGHGYPYPAGYGPSGHPHAAHPDMARSVLLQNATLTPPVGDLAANGSYANVSMGSVSHLGSAVVSSMNLTTDGLHAHAAAATSAASAEMMYYQNSAALASVAPAPGAAAAAAAAAADPAAPAGTDGGFLSQILGVDELQLMDMPMADGHPEWVSTSATDDQYSTPSDYAKASQAHRLYEYGGYRAAAAASPAAPGQPHDSRAANLPVAQKKHQMFGKRYFQGADGPYPGSGAVGTSVLPPGSPSPAAPLKYPPYGAEGGAPAVQPAYPPATPNPADMAAGLDSPELKYSCSMDFMRGHAGDRMGLVSHNHSYHLPAQAEGPSGVQRPLARDKHGERPKEHLTRDEKRARSMSIPLSTDDIIHLPMDEFNERLSKHDLTEAQLSLIRDIRRRGKNKLAAQNCRKRKLDQILTLAEEVQRAKDQKQQTLADHQFLLQERTRIKEKYSQLYRHVFQSLRDPDGNPYSPLEYSLQQSADGSILLVPRNTTSGATVEPDPSTGARRKQRDPQKPE